jgi:hypothetical protein
MAKKDAKDKLPNLRLPAAKMYPGGIFLKSQDLTIETRKLSEIAELIWIPPGLSEDERNARVLRALELYEDLKPVGSAEGMLAAQMVATHTTALDCLRRAAIQDQTFEGRDMSLKHAQKLMALYVQQLTALDKHRGKGQQKVTVEHVNVQAGGQAIVGSVKMGKRGKDEKQGPKAVEHKPEVPLSPDNPELKTSKPKQAD